MAKRPAIPQALKHRLYLEAGFKCAFPSCAFTDVEIHHIENWARVKEHSYDNLIALCPNHHTRATLGKIPAKSLKLLKAKLQTAFGLPVTKQRSGENWATATISKSFEAEEVVLEFPQLHSSTNESFGDINVLIHANMIEKIHELARQASLTSMEEVQEILEAQFRLRDEIRVDLGFPDLHSGETTVNPWALLQYKSAYLQSYSIVVMPTLVSIRYSIYSHSPIAAHPNRHTEVFNYCLQPLMHLTLNDLFLASADWVSFVSEIVKVTIRKSRSVTEEEDHFDYPSLESENNGEFPKLTKFAFMADCLVFIFDPYRLASYADGGWEVHIPYQALKQILRPDSVVNELIANKKRSARNALAFHF